MKDPKAKYGVTQFSDLSPEQFEQQFLNFPVHMIKEDKIPKKKQIINQFSISDLAGEISDFITGGDPDKYKTDDLPLNFDWRDTLNLTEPKQQGSCGSCWAFATTGILEAQYFKKYKKLINFSEQFLIDCDTNNYGCKGGLMTESYSYLEYNGIRTTDDYGKYKDRTEQCHLTSEQADSEFSIKVYDYYQIAKDERAIQRELVQNGPVAVGVNGRFLQFYQGGISDPEGCDDKLNHAVIIVGYGVDEKGTPYWTLKNEWGKAWGEKGYYKLVRGKQKCGIHTYASMAFLE